MRITFSDTCVHLIHIKYNEGEAWQDYLIQRVTITIYVQQLYITPPTQPPGVSIDKILHKKIMTIVLSHVENWGVMITDTDKDTDTDFLYFIIFIECFSSKGKQILLYYTWFLYVSNCFSKSFS